MKKNVEFLGIECAVDMEQTYPNGRPALILTDAEDGSGVCYASINIPQIDLEKDEVIIKNYSENQGVLDALIEAGIITKPVKEVQISQWVIAPICKIIKD